MLLPSAKSPKDGTCPGQALCSSLVSKVALKMKSQSCTLCQGGHSNQGVGDLSQNSPPELTDRATAEADNIHGDGSPSPLTCRGTPTWAAMSRMIASVTAVEA